MWMFKRFRQSPVNRAAANRVAISATDAFHTSLERECARSDRSGQVLSLVLVRVANNRPTSRSTRRTIDIVTSQVRVTDEVGWFSGYYVGVILPSTAAEGAHRVVEKIRYAAGRRGLRPLCVVYSYPTQWSEDDESGTPADDENRLMLRGTRPGRHRRNGTNGHSGHAGHTGHHGHMPNDHNGHDGRPDEGAHCHPDVPNGHPSGEAARQPSSTTLSAVMAPFLSGMASGFGAQSSVAPSGVEALPLELLICKPMPAWKRLMDIGVALIIGTLASPLLGVIAVGIRCSSKGPILFRQRRAGLGGRPFTMFKFRTMVVDAEAKKAALAGLNEQDGAAFKIRHDPRVTRFGRFLRRSSIDELPQLWNILRGEMTLVGPRPLPWKESLRCRQWQRRRLDTTPGLTCIWQVSGRSAVAFDEWVRMDLQYIRGRTVGCDLALLLKTVPAVLFGRGAC